MKGPGLRWLACLGLLLLLNQPAWAVKVSELSDLDILEQAQRFFLLKDPSLQNALLGAVLLGISCGLMGSFIVVRKMALMGDALSHAVLPGVAAGFLWTMEKDPLSIFIGATLAGLLGSAMVNWIIRSTRIKEDTAIGLILAGFYSVGICLVTMIQHLPSGKKSGIDKFLFGQIAALSSEDVQLMAWITGIASLLVLFFYKEFLVTSFDSAFGKTLGLPVEILHHSLMLLLAFAVVIALQAVGVVLVSAMLITPAAAAYLLTDRLKSMLILSMIFGMSAGVAGAFLSFLGKSLPTGPLMVLGASVLFLLAFLLAPQQGVLVRWIRRISRARRIQRENTLKGMYHVLEARDFVGESVSFEELAERRRETVDEARLQGIQLQKHGMATFTPDGYSLLFTPAGWERACAIVRNHRLWELYLTNAAHISADHVHEDAEKIEHVLGEAVVLQIEKRLQYATKDPHGRSIPSLQDIRAASSKYAKRPTAIGYGGKSN
jgi:ABC-type Mn2+/Zn2+ transport system permease subunit/Mn-dependent DtxR family transcriptional regulator